MVVQETRVRSPHGKPENRARPKAGWKVEGAEGGGSASPEHTCSFLTISPSFVFEELLLDLDQSRAHPVLI